MIFNTALSQIQLEFAASYDVSATIRHKGEKGRQREDGLASLLREHLPLAYGVATGEIIPHIGSNSSPQCDIIIYDQMHYPVIGRNKVVQLIPLEAVYCVIEVKSILNHSAIVEADQKFMKILDMPRCKPSSKFIKGKNRIPSFVTFGYKSKTTEDRITEYQQNTKYEYAIASLDKGIGSNIGIGKNERPIWINGKDKNGKYHTLAFLYFFILESIRNIDLGVPNYGQLLLGFE